MIRTAPDQHRFVLTIHHIVVDGWSLPILLQEIFASYYGQRLPAAGALSQVCHLVGRSGSWMPPGRHGVRCWLVLRPRRWWARRTGWGSGGERWPRFGCLPRPHGRLSELARSRRTTVNTVLQGAWAQLLMWLTGQQDVAFGTTVSGRPAEVVGADSMVGLLINTVPVRASITPTTTTADLLDQLQAAHNDTLEHQHLALREIHRVTGHDQLFDTLFVYENYPIDAAALSGGDGLAITEFTNREYNHYPLTVQALPGTELGLRVEFDTEVFDAAGIEALVERLRAGVGGDDRRSRPGGCRRWICWMSVSTPGWMRSVIGRC